MSCGRWEMNGCCRPSRLAEFVNGKGSLERCREQNCRHQACCQPPTSCCTECQDTSPTRFIIMPICCPRPKTPVPRNRLASIDILEEMLPGLNGCCTSEPTCFDPCCCKTSKKHRITLQQECPPLQKTNLTKWPNLPMPKRIRGCNINPCPPGPPCSSESDEDWDKKDTGTYYWNKTKGRFEPGPKPRRPRRPNITIVKASPPPCCPPHPPPLPIPWSIPPWGGFPWNPCQSMSPSCGYPGPFPLNLGPGGPPCFMQQPCCIMNPERKHRRRRRHGRHHKAHEADEGKEPANAEETSSKSKTSSSSPKASSASPKSNNDDAVNSTDDDNGD